MEALNILIVEDDEDFADALAELLEARGHRTTVAGSGDQAFVLHRQQSFDMILLDIMLPGISGLDCLEALRDIEPSARVIAMTGYPSREHVARARELDVLDVLRKPLDVVRLFELLEDTQPRTVVLLADDDRDFAQSMEQLLADHGYAVILARTGQEAVDRVLAGGVDMMLLDLRLPDLGGLEVFSELKKREAAPPTLIVTAYGKEEAPTIERMRAMTVRGWLSKPVDLPALLKSIEAATAG